MVACQRVLVLSVRRKICLGSILLVMLIGLTITGCVNGQKNGHWDICSCGGYETEICFWGGDQCTVGDRHESTKSSRD